MFYIENNRIAIVHKKDNNYHINIHDIKEDKSCIIECIILKNKPDAIVSFGNNYIAVLARFEISIYDIYGYYIMTIYNENEEVMYLININNNTSIIINSNYNIYLHEHQLKY